MQQFRSFVRGPVGVVMLVLFTIPFIVTGFYGYFTSSPAAAPVATVDDAEISTAMLQQRVEQLRQQMRQQSPQIDPAMIDGFIQPQMVLNGLVNNQLLANEAKHNRMRVSQEQVGSMIVEAPQFQVDGRYSNEAFQQFVRARGMTERSFISSIQKDLVMNQVRAGLADTNFSLPGELDEQRRLAEQQRDLVFVQKRVDKLAEQYSIEEADIEAHYSAHQDDYMRPEQFQLSYLLLSADTVDIDENVTDEQIQQEYEARLNALKLVAEASERRDASHIQLSLGDKRSEAEAQALVSTIQAKLDGGASFADLAREYSEDSATASGGGQLGAFSREELPEAMAQVLFSLREGQVSEAVEVEGNLHILKLNSIRSRELPALADLSDTIRADLKRARVEAALAEQAARLDELAFEHGDLQSPAAELGLTLQTTDWFNPGKASGFAANPAVLEALNTPAVKQDGHNSALLELGNNRYAVIHLAGRKPAEPLPLADVRDSIEKTLRMQRASTELDEMATQVDESLAQGVSIEAIANDIGGKLETAKAVTRQSRQPSLEVIRAAFALARPVEGGQLPKTSLRLANGDLVVVEVQAVNDGAGTILTEQQQAMALAELASVEGERSLGQSLRYMRDEADVVINESRLQGPPVPGLAE